MLSRFARTSLLAALAIAGCESTETTAGGGGSGEIVLPVGLTIESPTAGECRSVPLDREVGVPVTVRLVPPAGKKETDIDFARQPPGTCDPTATTPCGYLVLHVDREGTLVPNNAGTGPIIDLRSTPASPLSGPVTVAAKLVLENGNDYVDAKGNPLVATASFEAKASCEGGAGGGGSGGTGGTGGTGGSGGTGGAGGSGGAGGGSGRGGARAEQVEQVEPAGQGAAAEQVAQAARVAPAARQAPPRPPARAAQGAPAAPAAPAAADERPPLPCRGA